MAQPTSSARDIATFFLRLVVKSGLVRGQMNADSKLIQIFSHTIVNDVAMIFGPVAHLYENLKYFSAIPSRPIPAVHRNLLRATVQLSVYWNTEGNERPVHSLPQKSMQTHTSHRL